MCFVPSAFGAWHQKNIADCDFTPFLFAAITLIVTRSNTHAAVKWVESGEFVWNILWLTGVEYPAPVHTIIATYYGWCTSR